MIRKRPELDTQNPPGQIINRPRDYLATVNHSNFKAASIAVDYAREQLKHMGMTQEEAFDWIKAWALGAGDGSE